MSMAVADSRDHLIKEGCCSGYLNICRSPLQKRTFIILIISVGIVVTGLIIAVAVLAVNIKPSSSPERQTTCDSPECNLHAAQLLYRIDQTRNPCDDFYMYACGQGLQSFIVNPPAVSFSDFSQQQATINKRIQNMLKDNYDSGSVMEKPVKMYRACLSQNDTNSVEHLRELLASLGGWPYAVGEIWDDTNHMSTLDDLVPHLVNFSEYKQTGLLFQMAAMPDMRNTSRNLPVFFPANKKILYTPGDRENLTRQVEKAFVLFVQYFNVSSSMESLSKDLQYHLDVNDMIHELLSGTESNENDYQALTIDEFTKVTGGKFPWLEYLNGVFKNIKTSQFEGKDYIGIRGMNYFKNMSVALTAAFNHSIGRAIVNMEMTQMLIQASFFTKDREFIQQATALRQLITPSAKTFDPSEWLNTCIKWSYTWFDFALANEYAKRFVDVTEIVQKSSELTTYIMRVYEDSLTKLSWLDDKAHKAALDKIHQMTKYYNYPEWAADTEQVKKFYSEFEVGEDHAMNFIAFVKFDSQRSYRRINGDDTGLFKRWPKSPLVVNAFYVPGENSITIPQAILQSPIFGADRLKVMNFGAIGSVIGHEITHGFDLAGRQYDGKGNLADWMSPEVLQTFMTKAMCFMNQYSNYSLTLDDATGAETTLWVDGRMTLSENIADGGGIRNAYLAYKRWEEDYGVEVLPSFLQQFTSDQIFFISYAHTWCTEYSDDVPRIKQAIKGDEHSPAHVRILGALSNFEKFSEVFSCKDGDRMNPDDRCILW